MAVDDMILDPECSDDRAIGGAESRGACRSVSVALATFNGAPFLQAQLDSLHAQTLPPAELVIGDDGSNDETAAIVHAFAETAPFPVHFRVNGERLHFSENFLRTAARCKSRYVAFCDQDDVWLPEKLERSVTAMEAADALLCGHDAWLIDAKGARVGRFAHLKRGGVYRPLTLAPWGVFFGFSTTIRRDLLETLPAARRGLDPIDPKHMLAHDRWVYHLGTTLGRTVYLKDPLVLYRQHGRNTFGASVAGSAFSKLGKLMLTSSGDLALHLDICRKRQALLASLESGPLATQARAGAAYWERLVAVYEQRLAIAVTPSSPSRCAILFGLVRRGAYASAARGGLTTRAFVKDALATVLPWRASVPAQAPIEGVLS